MATDPTNESRTDSPTETPVGESVAPPETGWVTLASPEIDGSSEPPLRMRRIVSQLLVGVVLVLIAVLIAVTVGGTLAARRLAEREAVNDAAATANVLANMVVQPSLTDELMAGDDQAVKEFDHLVRDRIMKSDDVVVRVKLWGKDGTILYSDQPELIGKKFPLEGEQRESLADDRTGAEISDLSRTENALDRKVGNKLVEVYRPVWSPNGTEALFEIYTPYTAVTQRTTQLWRGFAGVTLGSLLLFVVLLAPLLWHLLRRVRRAQRHQRVQRRPTTRSGSSSTASGSRTAHGSQDITSA